MMAPIDSMENTVELGRIRLRAAENETIRRAFIEVLKMMIADVAKEKGMGLADWQIQKPMPPSKGRA
jgi:peptide deformylase